MIHTPIAGEMLFTPFANIFAIECGVTMLLSFAVRQANSAAIPGIKRSIALERLFAPAAPRRSVKKVSLKR